MNPNTDYTPSAPPKEYGPLPHNEPTGINHSGTPGYSFSRSVTHQAAGPGTAEPAPYPPPPYDEVFTMGLSQRKVTPSDNHIPPTDALIQQRLTGIAAKLGIPATLVDLFHQIRQYRILLIIDNSGSMHTTDTQLLITEGRGERELSRMDELKLRLNTIAPLLATLADQGMIVQPLHGNTLFIDRGLSMEHREQQLRECINSIKANGNTPLIRILGDQFATALRTNTPTIAYVMTDGEPSDSGFQSSEGAISRLLSGFRHSARGDFFPISFMACTGDDDEVAWMDNIDKHIPNVQVTDDYFSESEQVANAHGPIHYTHGTYLAAYLLGPIYPLLDKLDEASPPLTMEELAILSGYPVSPLDYQNYRAAMATGRSALNVPKTLELDGIMLKRKLDHGSGNNYGNNRDNSHDLCVIQ